MRRHPPRRGDRASARTATMALAVAGVVAVLMTVAVGTAPAAAQPDGSAGPAVTVGLHAVTPWVGDTGTWIAEFDSTGLPFDGDVRVSVRQRLRGTEPEIRQRLTAQVAGEQIGSQIVASRPTKVLEVIDTTGRVRVELPLRGAQTDRDRIRLPERGLYPVVVTFLAADGTELHTELLHLAYVGSEPPGPLSLSVVTPVRSGPVLDTDGVPDVTEAATAAERQLGLAAAAGALALTVDLDPEVLVGLARSDRPTDRALLDRLAEHLRAHRVLRRTWAPVDLEGWARAGRAGVVTESLESGQQAVADQARQLVDPRGWGPDPTLGPKGLELLVDTGVDYVITSEDRLEPATPPRGETGTSRPIRLGSGRRTMAALVLDAGVQQTLADDTAPPEVVAHRALVEVLAAWFGEGAGPRAMVVELPSSVPTAVAEAFLGALRSPAPNVGGPILVAEPDRLLEEVTPISVRRNGRDQPWSRSLRTVPAGESDAARRRSADRITELRARTTAAASMLPDGDPNIATASTALLAVVHRSLGATDRTRLLDVVATTDDRALEAVTTPGRRTVTVTAREATIPLRLSNRHDQPLRVRLRFESPRLRFLRGEVQDVTLQPGNNRIEIPVSVRSSGEFLLRSTIESPEGAVVLARSTIRVRSSTFSGVGLILSGGALLVLVVWWGRTIRRGPSPDGASESPGANDADR